MHEPMTIPLHLIRLAKIFIYNKASSILFMIKRYKKIKSLFSCVIGSKSTSKSKNYGDLHNTLQHSDINADKERTRFCLKI